MPCIPTNIRCEALRRVADNAGHDATRFHCCQYFAHAWCGHSGGNRASPALDSRPFNDAQYGRPTVMDPTTVTTLGAIGVMVIWGWLMLRGGRGRGRVTEHSRPQVPHRFDHAVTMTLVAAVTFQFFAGRVPSGTLSMEIAFVSAAIVVTLVAFVPQTKNLISVAALGIFLIENYGVLGVTGFAFLGSVLVLSILAHSLLGK